MNRERAERFNWQDGDFQIEYPDEKPKAEEPMPSPAKKSGDDDEQPGATLTAGNGNGKRPSGVGA